MCIICIPCHLSSHVLILLFQFSITYSHSFFLFGSTFFVCFFLFLQNFSSLVLFLVSLHTVNFYFYPYNSISFHFCLSLSTHLFLFPFFHCVANYCVSPNVVFIYYTIDLHPLSGLLQLFPSLCLYFSLFPFSLLLYSFLILSLTLLLFLPFSSLYFSCNIPPRAILFHKIIVNGRPSCIFICDHLT